MAKLFEERARRCLPVLVQIAWLKRTITYGELAFQLDMPNPRNLSYVLGEVGEMLLKAAKGLGERVPPIQTIVVSKNKGVPSEGILYFKDMPELAGVEDAIHKDPITRRIYWDGVQKLVFDYQDWIKVLHYLSLDSEVAILTRAAFLGERKTLGGYGGPSESEEHKSFKTYVLENYKTVVPGIDTAQLSIIEYCIYLTGDTVDVYLEDDKYCYPVEVKSRISSDEDILRGIFQCIKYRALLEARNVIELKDKNVVPILVIGREISSEAFRYCELFQVKVVIQLLP